MTPDDKNEKTDASEPIQDLDETVGAADADSVKGGFNPQPDPPKIRGFDPQQNPPMWRNPGQGLGH
ncbi:MAG: hypothetical protein ABI664_08340 [bacterium]